MPSRTAFRMAMSLASPFFSYAPTVIQGPATGTVSQADPPLKFLLEASAIERPYPTPVRRMPPVNARLDVVPSGFACATWDARRHAALSRNPTWFTPSLRACNFGWARSRLRTFRSAAVARACTGGRGIREAQFAQPDAIWAALAVLRADEVAATTIDPAIRDAFRRVPRVARALGDAVGATRTVGPDRAADRATNARIVVATIDANLSACAFCTRTGTSRPDFSTFV
jgi:hypothetical protein